MDMSSTKFWEMVKDREAWHTAVHGVTKSWTRLSNWTTITTHASQVKLKILHARLQHYVKQELPDVPAGFRKGRRTKDQNANIRWIKEKAREFQKNIYLCFINYAKTFGCVEHDKLWKALKKMGILEHLNQLLRNLYVGQEATVRTLCGTTDWFKIIERGMTGLSAITLFV